MECRKKHVNKHNKNKNILNLPNLFWVCFMRIALPLLYKLSYWENLWFVLLLGQNCLHYVQYIFQISLSKPNLNNTLTKKTNQFSCFIAFEYILQKCSTWKTYHKRDVSLSPEWKKNSFGILIPPALLFSSNHHIWSHPQATYFLMQRIFSNAKNSWTKIKISGLLLSGFKIVKTLSISEKKIVNAGQFLLNHSTSWRPRQQKTLPLAVKEKDIWKCKSIFLFYFPKKHASRPAHLKGYKSCLTMGFQHSKINKTHTSIKNRHQIHWG